MFQVWVITNGDTNWASNGKQYDTSDEALDAGQRMFNSWYAVQRWAVCPSDGAPQARMTEDQVVSLAVGGVRP